MLVFLHGLRVWLLGFSGPHVLQRSEKLGLTNLLKVDVKAAGGYGSLQIYTPEHYNPYSGDPQTVPQMLGNPLSRSIDLALLGTKDRV